MNRLIVAVAATLALTVCTMNARAEPNCVDYITAERAFHSTRLITDTANEEVSRRAFFSFGAGSPGSEAARNVANFLSQESLRVAEQDREREFLKAWANPTGSTHRAVPSASQNDRRAAVLELARRERRGCGSWVSANPRRHAPSAAEYKELREASRKTRHNANCIEYVSAELRMKKAVRKAHEIRKNALHVAGERARQSYEETARQASASELTYDDAIAKVNSIAADHWKAVVGTIEDSHQSIAMADTERKHAELSAWANPVDAPKRSIPDLLDERKLVRIQTLISFEREYCKDPSSKVGRKMKI